jgi:phosphopantothenoylcysteine decarboxylase/phosphopantothenate--cysteine ligase
MACGEHGEGRIADVETIAEAVRMTVAAPKDLAGKRFVVTSGPTREPVDPVRFISNRSSGKMGSAVARALALRGAEVTFVHGPSEVPPPYGVRAVPVETAAQMRAKTVEAWRRADGAVLAAAVADFKPAAAAPHKIKKAAGIPDLKLVATPDILAELGRGKGNKFLCGFAAETKGLLKNAALKLRAKNLDMVVANDVSDRHGGFGSDSNAAFILMRDGRSLEVPLCAKFELAWTITDAIAGMLHAKGRKRAGG